MLSKKGVTIINIALGLLLIILLLNFFEIPLPSVGKARYLLEKSEALCAIEMEGQFTLWPDLPRCCLMATQQLECVSSFAGPFSRVCATGQSPRYWLSEKAYLYCQQLPVWSQ